MLSLPEDQPEGELAYRRVEEVFRRWGVIWEVVVSGQVLRTTAEHPFWVRGRGWVAARELRVGDELRSHDGQWVAVEGVRNTGREEVVYNCRVAEYHTYFVGDESWPYSVWAHNAYDIIGRGERWHGRFPKEYKPNSVLYRTDGQRIISYQVYNRFGKPLKRVDLVGKAHAGIATPHTHVWQYNKKIQVIRKIVREAFPWELP